MTEQEAREKILDIITELCGDDTAREDPDVDLVEEGLLDSLDYVEMLLEFEEAFDIVVAPSEFTMEEMATPNKIIAQILTRL